MSKKYVFILFYFFMSNNLVAQLLQDLAKFTQTLKNLAAKLPAGVVPPPRRPSSGGVQKIIVPASGVVTLPNGKKVKAPKGSVIEYSGRREEYLKVGIPTGVGYFDVKVAASGGVVMVPAGTVEVSHSTSAGEVF